MKPEKFITKLHDINANIMLNYNLTPELTVGDLYELLASNKFIEDSDLKIPKWFVSIGRKGLPCTMAPDWPSVFPACRIHDFLYWAGGKKEDKNIADLVFHVVLEHNAELWHDDRERGWVSTFGGKILASLFHNAVMFTTPFMKAFTFRNSGRLPMYDTWYLMWIHSKERAKYIEEHGSENS